MHYNESSVPRLSRNPLGQRSANFLSNLSSKKSSTTFNQSFHLPNQSRFQTSQSRKSMDQNMSMSHFKKNSNFQSTQKISKHPHKEPETKQRKIQRLRFEINNKENNMHMSSCFQGSRRNSNSKATISKCNRSNHEKFMTQTSQADISFEESMFSPKILNKSKSMMRKLNVSTLLYEDAVRRQQKQQNLQQSQRKQIDMMMSPKINSNTNALVLRKIQSQFSQLVTEDQINPLIALSVLQQIFNVNLNPHKQSQNYELVQNMISLLTGSNYHDQIRTQKLWQFICLIVTSYTENSLFSNEEEKQIIEKYQHFYKQRVTRERNTPTPEKCTFRPKILDSSSKLAQSFRQKTCRKIDNFIENQKVNLNIDPDSYTIEDLYVLEHHKKLAENERKRIQKQNKQLQLCTFKPDLSPSSTTAKVVKVKPKIPLKINKAQQLRTQHTLSSQDNQKSMVISSKIIPIRSREERQRKRKQKEKDTSIIENVKDMEKVVLRMSVGRQKRQFSNKIRERGYPVDENWTQYQQQMHRESVENIKKLKGLGK